MGGAWRVAAVAVPLLLVAGHCVVMSMLSDPWRNWFISEYGPAEMLSAGAFGACALVAARLLRGHWGAIPARYRALLVVFALGSAFVSVEEISYGQTFWEYHTPDWFVERNNQREFNLHNLAGDKPSRFLRRVGEIGMPLIGLALPLLWMRRKGGYEPGTVGFHLFPRFELVGAVAGSMAIRMIWWWRKSLERMPEWTAGMSELQELIWAFAGVVWIVEMARRLESRGGAPAAPADSEV